MKLTVRFFCFLLFFFILLSGHLNAQQKIYISLTGSDNNDGSISKPFATINKAKSAVRAITQNGLNTNVQVILRGGVYEVTNTLNFGPQDGGNENYSVTYMAYPGEKVIISGGEKLTGPWKKEGANIWVYKTGAPKSDKAVPRSLYVDDTRLVRAHSPVYYTQEQLPEFRNSYKSGVFDDKSFPRLTVDSITAFSGFTYSGNDLDNMQNDIGSAEIILYESWDTSVHDIYKIDPSKKTVLLKSPAHFPVGFFSKRTRYIVENVKSFLNAPGTWCYDKQSGYLYYYGNTKDNPNNMSFYMPVLSKMMLIKGNSNNFVTNLNFVGIDFRYTNSEWGVTTLTPAKQQSNLAHYPWLDFSTGFTSPQGAFTSGQAIFTQYAKNCSFENCRFFGLDNYALRIGEYSANNTVDNCVITSCGSGGVMIGIDNNDPVGQHLNPASSPSRNVVTNTKIYNCGLLHRTADAIAVVQANHTLIAHNLIYNMPYTGIAVGWNFKSQDNFTSYNLIEYNHIHDVMQQLADGGGIYTLGKQVGCVYRCNYIYNISRSNDAVGSFNNGIFFDESSSLMKVDSNVIYNVKNATIRFNHSDVSQISIGTNYFEKVNSNKQLQNAIFQKVLK
ncbi:right-handed parallel beta-helix repeat-containing protein [Mucilaginibacter ginsenosidivorax]|uniref:Right-handed parallel beta-helix repeat-containing protein n=1 Tax=Mucilaginibacter ginsenosidivorax TaxID=862126 RepID=A0A5B8W2L0_9SPHI|nr:right-handed parallel beta-helix repeat-containing protein [Mucilaginibacter ginsenosidivorax]QEC78084.1 right-handed parallel beta-helix repeat-containing protein [Mucilaginibacter ginsenosidivorax]